MLDLENSVVEADYSYQISKLKLDAETQLIAQKNATVSALDYQHSQLAVKQQNQYWLSQMQKVEKMKASSLDTGLLYLRIAHHINETLGDGRDNNGAFELTLVEFLNYIINMIEKDTIRYESMLDKKAHWGTRMNNFFIPVIKEFIQHKKDNTGKKTGRAKLVDTKKIEARKLLTTKLGTEFPILDRIRKNPDGCDKIFQWEIRDFNTTTGEGGQLCHYVSSNNNGILSEENTGDNVMMGDNDCEKIHLTVDGEFYKAFIKDNPTPPTDELEMEAWLNNKKYAAVHAHLIVEEIRKNLVSA